MDSFILFILIQTALSIFQQIHCQSSVQPRSRQFIIVLANASWNEAMKDCEGRSGHLLTIDSKEKDELLTQLDKEPSWNKLLENGEYWIGLHNRENESCSDVHHFWQRGCQPVGWSRWRSGDPSDCINNRCVVMRDMKWSTANCRENYSFVCEKNIDCIYTRDVNVTLKDVTVTQLTLKRNVEISCETLCSSMAIEEFDGCSAFPDQNTCSFLFVNSGHRDQRLTDSYDGTEYVFKNCSDVVAMVETMAQFPQGLKEFPETDCACVIGEDYYEFVDDYRGSIIPSPYKTIDIIGKEDDCKKICQQSELNGRQCWAINRFSVLSNFCRLYYLQQEPPFLFYQRYVSRVPGVLLLRRRMEKPRIEDDGIVDNIEELKINPKNTTLYNLKFISVFENKTSKLSMGVIGSLFMGICITAVIIADCSVINRHIKTIGMRNIRNRTICQRRKRACNKTEQDPGTKTESSSFEEETTSSKKSTSPINTPSTSQKRESVKVHSSAQTDFV